LIAAHSEVDLKRHYLTLLRRRGRPKAIVAMVPETARAALHHAPGSDWLRGIPTAWPDAARAGGAATGPRI